jgi:hypothetical protein
LERIATSDRVTLVVERIVGGKMARHVKQLGSRARLARDQVLEVRNVEGRLHVARKERRPDECDAQIEPYDPAGLGQRALSDFGVITDEPVTRDAEPHHASPLPLESRHRPSAPNQNSNWEMTLRTLSRCCLARI